MAELYLGTSGYQYPHWKRVFYPEDLPKKRWFSYYTDFFETVEINNTFYRLPEPHTFDAWREQTPEGFTYALKFSRFGTHMKKLKDPEQVLGNFVPRAERLGQHLGPILVQLPPNWGVDVGRLRAFLEAAPAERRWAVELRDPRWFTEPVFEALADHGAALVIHDMLAEQPRRTTADWVYQRFHGVRYRGSYSAQALTAEAQRIAEHLEAGHDVYAYFNNDERGYAARNALDLRRYVANAVPARTTM